MNDRIHQANKRQKEKSKIAQQFSLKIQIEYKKSDKYSNSISLIIQTHENDTIIVIQLEKWHVKYQFSTSPQDKLF